MLAIATAVTAAMPTIPIMPNGSRARVWRNGTPVFAGRLAGKTRPLAFAGGLVDVGGGGAVTVDGLAAASTGMTIPVAVVVWVVAAGAGVAVESLLVDGAVVAPAGLAAAGAATAAEGLPIGDAAALAGLDATEAAVKAGGLTVGNVVAPAGLDATEGFGEPAGLAVTAAAFAGLAAAGVTVGLTAAAIVAGGGQGIVAFASVGPNEATNDAAISRVAFASANASSAARDNNCMSSGLSTISIVSSSRLS